MILYLQNQISHINRRNIKGRPVLIQLRHLSNKGHLTRALAPFLRLELI